MAINIKNLEERIQKKVHLVDSNTSVDDLTDMVEASLLLTGSLKTYADSSELPTATGSNEKIGFIQDIKAIRFNNGKEWVTTASGEVQAPAGGGGSSVTAMRGSVSGYAAGGETPSTYSDTVDKYSFSSDGNATDVGNLATNRYLHGGGQDGTNLYVSAGRNLPTGTFPVNIEKIPFASDGNATDTTYDALGGGHGTATMSHSVGDGTNVYFTEQIRTPFTSSYIPGAPTRAMQKFPGSSNAAETGYLLSAPTGPGQMEDRGGHCASGTHGYIAGALVYSPSESAIDTIQKFPFASDWTSVATDVGNLSNPFAGSNAGANSETHGYSHGGKQYAPPTNWTNIIEKWSFSADGNSTDVGDLLGVIRNNSGSSSPSYGHSAGGKGSPSAHSNVIQKFAFASDGNSTDVGDLTLARGKLSGHSG